MDLAGITFSDFEISIQLIGMTIHQNLISAGTIFSEKQAIH